MTGPRLTRVRVASGAPLSPALRRVRGHAPTYLLARRALSPAEATAYQPRDALDRRELHRLLRQLSVRRAGEHYWLDLAAYHAAAARRGRRAMATVLPVSLAVALLAVFLYR